MRKAALIIIGLAGAGCGSVKHTINTDTSVTQVTLRKADSSSVTETITKFYSDSLQGQSFIPADSLTSDTAGYIIHGQSTGLSFFETLTPLKTAGGKLAGFKASYTAIAKPKAITSTTQTEQADVRETMQKDSAVKVQSATTTKAGLSVPWWCWLLAGLATVGVAWYLFKKYSPIKL
ncbi:hypothetical protein [Mucilaginibacter sp. L3T2-6]|uniref:hypothetical protein n=1 Tax=Mucilaginibacter sp. L3T2-6 TaxID=3062491 RepID=UPI002674D3EF|nr:hypothetical protein [Mucilaginibacter sp. L3T2-6]MDO3641972.1 hypothetical protein [Mucilaginibacter sp. L3T2-6]MDV6214350.1 hypothetical protein [Mucilaginibacter sp. L3T2-6]